ncbi:Chromatin modification-related protein YNG2 [Exaiptasia diaphana]|nr:Chromatin modification-related protein YNG2 [Exaiptasia diaphana]
MSSTSRSWRYRLISCFRNQFLHAKAVQMFQKFRSLQPNGIGIHNKRPRQSFQRQVRSDWQTWTRINGSLACTQVKCTWLLPTYVKEVNYEEVKAINLKSARRLKAELDQKVDEGNVNLDRSAASSNHSKSLQSCTPTDKEIGDLFLKLNDCKRKTAILSLVPPYADSFVLKSRRIPALTDLFDPENMKLNYVDLLAKCSEINITLSDSELHLIEQDTKDQAQTSAFFTHRAGRIGASQSHSAVHTNSFQPSISLVKSICYPQLFKVTTKATVYGCKNEAKAIDAYSTAMSKKHIDLKVTKCGMFIDKSRPWMHATPDFLSTCTCCGDACGEVKCPYGLKDGNFESYLTKKSSCLERTGNNLQLKRNHPYYYQTLGKNHWEFVIPKRSKMWRTCILPELTFRWYTRKQHIHTAPSNDPNGICYCRKVTNDCTLDCSNPDCAIKKFHYSCLQMSDPIPKTWYCPNCRLLPKFQKQKKTTKACNSTSHIDEAMKLSSVCICGKKPCRTDKLLKCNNNECENGQFFHLHCLDYKRMPSNSKTTWMCSNCKVKRTYQPAATGPSQTSAPAASTIKLPLVLLSNPIHQSQEIM